MENNELIAIALSFLKANLIDAEEALDITINADQLEELEKEYYNIRRKIT